MKTGNFKLVAASATNDALAEATSASIIPPSAARGSLGDICEAAIQGMPTPALAVVSFSSKKVGIWKATNATIAALLAILPISFKFEPVDANRPSMLFTCVDENDASALPSAPVPSGSDTVLAINSEIGWTRPTKTIAGMISALENVAAATEKDGYAVVDQANARIWYFEQDTIATDVSAEDFITGREADFVASYELEIVSVGVVGPFAQ